MPTYQSPKEATTEQPPTIHYVPRKPLKIEIGVVQIPDNKFKATTQVNIPTKIPTATEIDREIAWAAGGFILLIVIGFLVVMRWNHGT